MEKVRRVVRKARLSSKGQITIPVEVREVLGLEQGDTVVFDIGPGGAEIRKAPTAGDLLGFVAVPEELKGVPWKVARRMAWEARAKRYRDLFVTRT